MQKIKINSSSDKKKQNQEFKEKLKHYKHITTSTIALFVSLADYLDSKGKDTKLNNESRKKISYSIRSIVHHVVILVEGREPYPDSLK